MKRLLTVIVMAAILVGGSVAGSVAGKKVIKPYELQPFDSDASYVQWPTYVKSKTNSLVHFYAVVKLPVGKVIKNLEYYHYGNSSTASTAVYIFRQLPGEDVVEQICGANGTGAGFMTLRNPGSIANAKIKRGYTYYVQATSFNLDSQLKSIKITYK